MGVALITAPTVPPISIAEAKSQLRVPHDDDDALITSLVEAARERAEAVTGRQLLQATWELRLDAFPCEYEIQIPKPPLISVTSFSYVDTAGVTQVWAAPNYQVDAPAGPFADRGRIQPAFAINWPAARTDTMNAVLIRFIAGYGTQASAVPMPIRQAMQLMITHWYENRSDVAMKDVAPLGALALLTPYKMHC